MEWTTNAKKNQWKKLRCIVEVTTKDTNEKDLRWMVERALQRSYDDFGRPLTRFGKIRVVSYNKYQASQKGKA